MGRLAELVGGVFAALHGTIAEKEQQILELKIENKRLKKQTIELKVKIKKSQKLILL
jgi:hypothetical protein